MYYIWFILNFPKCIHLVNVNTIYRKETQGWLRGHWGVAGCMNCRVSGLLKNVSELYFFVNGFLLKDCYTPKIASLFQQQFWRSLLTSEITCLNDFVMLILAQTTQAPRLKFYSDYNRGLMLKQNKGIWALLSESLTLLTWTYILACSLDSTNGKSRKKNPLISVE